MHPTQHPFLFFPVPRETLPLIYPFFLRRKIMSASHQDWRAQRYLASVLDILAKILISSTLLFVSCFSNAKEKCSLKHVHPTPQIPPICLLRHLTLHFFSSQTFLCEYSLNISISSTRHAYKNSVRYIVC